MGRPFIDISWRKFGKLSPVKFTGIRKTPKGYLRFWKCKCDCGNECERSYSDLMRGHAKSCGCMALSGLTPGWNKKSPGESAMHSMYMSYQKSAHYRHYKFELSKERFVEITSSNCFYCGIEPSTIYHSRSIAGGDYVYNGIDRVDNAIGYVEGNVVPCCKDCNTAKASLSKDQFYSWVRRVYARIEGNTDNI